MRLRGTQCHTEFHLQEELPLMNRPGPNAEAAPEGLSTMWRVSSVVIEPTLVSDPADRHRWGGRLPPNAARTWPAGTGSIERPHRTSRHVDSRSVMPLAARDTDQLAWGEVIQGELSPTQRGRSKSAQDTSS